MREVYIVESNHEYDTMFVHLGFHLTPFMDEADLFCFTGGEDVTPSMYGAYQHSQTYNSPERDEYEKKIFNKYIDVPKVGICRGGQFLNVMSGGKMYQHVEGHCQQHTIKDILTDETIDVSSTHHQMMMPGKKALVVARDARDDSFKREWFNGVEYHEAVEDAGIEVVWYEETNSLCFQPHPEFSVFEDDYLPMLKYFTSLLDRFFTL